MAAAKPAIYYAAIIRRKDTTIDAPTLELSKAWYLAAFNRFTHGSYKEGMIFTATTVAERTGPGMRQEVKEGSYHCYTYGHSSQICAVIIANAEYPRLVAHQHLSQMMDEFTSQYPRSKYQNLAKDPRSYDDPIPWPALQKHIDPESSQNPNSWQNPNNGDSISQAQRELVETKTILHKTIESVLERGEKIDNLVAKSEGLSASSKMFYSQAKKQNSCCVVM